MVYGRTEHIPSWNIQKVLIFLQLVVESIQNLFPFHCLVNSEMLYRISLNVYAKISRFHNNIFANGRQYFILIQNWKVHLKLRNAMLLVM